MSVGCCDLNPFGAAARASRPAAVQAPFPVLLGRSCNAQMHHMNGDSTRCAQHARPRATPACRRTPPPPLAAPHVPHTSCLLAELPFGNPLFAAPGLSPSPAQNPVFSPATLGTAPQSAVGMRRLAALPPSQLQAAAAAAAAGGSPASSDAAMADNDAFMDEEEGGQPPADSLAVASPGGAGSGGSRERPEEDEFASVLGAGERVVALRRWVAMDQGPHSSVPPALTPCPSLCAASHDCVSMSPRLPPPFH